MSYVMRECNSYIYYLLSYIIMWYKFKMLAISRGVHPAQTSSSGNPGNVSISQEKPFLAKLFASLTQFASSLR